MKLKYYYYKYFGKSKNINKNIDNNNIKIVSNEYFSISNLKCKCGKGLELCKILNSYCVHR
jgi:hypothetical protein